jgi:glycerophosphoryl diester phosphodiesterase
MNWLLFREESRSGQFEIRKGVEGQVQILTGDPFVVAMIESTNPIQEFWFRIPCYKDSKVIGICNFDVSEMGTSKYVCKTIPISGSPDCGTITASICWVTPTHMPLLDQTTIDYPAAFVIGHRGSGSNRIRHEFLENSMKSFEAATENNANFIEFDVQMTKDVVPVVFHDLAGILAKDPIPEVEPPHEITNDGYSRYAIKQLTEAEFRRTGLMTEYDTERSTLVDLLISLPLSVGFDVELKYPSLTKFNQSIPYFDINQFVDEILEVIVKHAKTRQIFFSSFDPFVCAMLRLKQKKWPVMQLFNRKKRWCELDTSMSWRMNSIAVLHRNIGVQGFIIDSDNLMQEPDLIPSLTGQGFIVCSYGTLNNRREGIEGQLSLGVRGICTDDVPLAHAVIDEHLKRTVVS